MKRIIIVLSVLLSFSFANAEKIASVKTSGFFAKDTLNVYAEDDPDYKNIVCYTTNVDIAGWGADPTDSSITCRLYGEFIYKKDKNGKNILPTSRSEIFTKSKSPFFKTMIVDRVYDKKRNTLIYLVYTKKFSGKNAAHSSTAVALGAPLLPKEK